MPPIPTLITLLYKFIAFHRYALFDYLDPIATTVSNGQNRSKWDTHFIYPTFIVLIFFLYGNVCIQYFETGTFYWLSMYENGPRIVFHQSFPRQMWPQSDMAISMGFLGAVAIYFSFFHNPFTKSYSLVSNFKGKKQLIIENIG